MKDSRNIAKMIIAILLVVLALTEQLSAVVVTSNNLTISNTAAGDDAGLFAPGWSGNLVPNASFENSSINFFNLGSYVSDPGKHGSQVLRYAASALDAHIGLPVVPGQLYGFSYWYSGSGELGIEYGLSVPGDGFAVGAGNVQIYVPSAGPWTEVTGTFTPGAGQTMFYMGGMPATFGSGYVQFDSLLLSSAPAPEPAVATLLCLGGLWVWRRRNSLE